MGVLDTLRDLARLLRAISIFLVGFVAGFAFCLALANQALAEDTTWTLHEYPDKNVAVAQVDAWIPHVRGNGRTGRAARVGVICGNGNLVLYVQVPGLVMESRIFVTRFAWHVGAQRYGVYATSPDHPGMWSYLYALPGQEGLLARLGRGDPFSLLVQHVEIPENGRVVSFTLLVPAGAAPVLERLRDMDCANVLDE